MNVNALREILDVLAGKGLGNLPLDVEFTKSFSVDDLLAQVEGLVPAREIEIRGTLEEVYDVKVYEHDGKAVVVSIFAREKKN